MTLLNVTTFDAICCDFCGDTTPPRKQPEPSFRFAWDGSLPKRSELPEGWHVIEVARSLLDACPTCWATPISLGRLHAATRDGRRPIRSFTPEGIFPGDARTCDSCQHAEHAAPCTALTRGLGAACCGCAKEGRPSVAAAPPPVDVALPPGACPMCEHPAHRSPCAHPLTSHSIATCGCPMFTTTEKKEI